MPDIDTSELLLDPDFVGCPSVNPTDGITVIRRLEVISQTGRVTTQDTTYPLVVASVQPQSDAPMIRGPDQQNLPGLIEVHTKFRLRGISPGYQPDLVIWNQTTFVVNKIYNWSRYGLGFVMAECSSMSNLDFPPTGDEGGDGP